MHVPMLNSRCTDMLMSDAMKTARQNKEDKDLNFNRALRLQKVYPHLKSVTVKFLMWAIHRLKFKKVEETAAQNLTSFTFKNAIQQLAR